MLAAPAFAYVRDLLERESAICLAGRQQYLVEARLAPLARAHALPSVDALVERLRREPGPALRSQVVEAMTTNETSFFRDLHPFTALERTIVPELLARRAEERRLRIWSAACSTGQEPYSVAMLLLDRFPQLRGWSVEILATDLAEGVVARARTGRYTQMEVNRGLPASQLVRHFTRDGTAWVLREPARSLVTFRTLNLAAPWPALPAMDLVLLRNVLIYFSQPAKRAVLDRVARVLRPGGWLLLGAAETTMHLHDRFRHVPVAQASCYRLEEAEHGSR